MRVLFKRLTRGIARGLNFSFSSGVSEQQLHLFQPAKPLLVRFGDEFFRAVPPRPGVYIMGGEGERILYIGQSKNLRHRLGSYKNARPDRAPRKVIRLVHSVRTIVWEECATAKAARIRENQLLQLHRPKFNVMNTWPKAYRFVVVQITRAGFAIKLTGEPGAEGRVFGAFKGAMPAFTPLLRLLWAAWRQPESMFDFPARLMREGVREFEFVTGTETEKWVVSVHAFFAGDSNELLTTFADALPDTDQMPAFQRSLHANDLEIVSAFFERGPKRHRRIRTEHGFDQEIIPQEQLDDWLVIAGNA